MSFVVESPPPPTAAHVDRADDRAPASPSRVRRNLPPDTSRRLRTANLVAGLFHFVQSIVFLLIVTDFDLPVTTSFATDDPALLQGAPPTEVWFDVTIGYGVAAFSLLSACFHLLVATVARRTYDRGIANGQNPFRWLEYSLSASLMIVLILMLLGVYDVGALIAVAGVNASMILFGWVMERVNEPGADDVDWFPFAFGCVAGVIPWIVGAIYFAGALGNADEAVPPWVWGIFASVFVLFNCFALNQALQYRAVGRWRRYVFGEGVYIVLSLGAKSALMWQVYFGTVR